MAAPSGIPFLNWLSEFSNLNDCETCTTDVYSTTWFGLFKILFRWKGSIWKAIFSELIVWSIAYIALNLSLVYLFNDTQRSNFEDFRSKLADQIRDYPIVFMLGFYVQVIFNRWVSIFQYIGFIDNIALSISTAIKGHDIETRLLKRNIVRYSVLSQALVFRDISLPCRTRFPDIESFVDCGLMTQAEYQIFEARVLPVGKTWIPIQWALNLIVLAREQNKVASDQILWNSQEKVREFRNNLQRLACFDWVPVPVSYPQIIYLLVRCYFCLLLISSQILRDQSIGLAIVDSTRMPPTDELDPLWSLNVPQPLDTLTNKNKFKKDTPYSGSVADVDMSRQTHDPGYLMERARRRTFINRMASNQSLNLSPIHDPDHNPFFEGQPNRFGSPRTKNTAQIHRLDSVNEIDESRRESTKNDNASSPKTSTTRKVSIVTGENVEQNETKKST